MQLTLRQQLRQFGHILQQQLFPVLEDELGPLTPSAKLLVAILNLAPLTRFIPVAQGWNGRPVKDRYAIACAMIAKAVYNLPTTSKLLEKLAEDEQLRRICGWRYAHQVPHSSTFSRAFAEFALLQLPQMVHEALVRETQKERIIAHIARDSTAIHARERFPETAPKATQKPAPPVKVSSPGGKHKTRKMKHGRLVRPARAVPTRLERQRTMTLQQMLSELPTSCSIGTKKSPSGHNRYWRGYKLHLDVADGQIPISAVLTGANVHDSQVAIPLAVMSSQRVTSLYALMDSAYDAYEIHQHTRAMSQVPIIAPKNCGRPTKNVIAPGAQRRQLSWAEAERFKERTMVERVYARLKDEFGARHIRVRGAEKVVTHVMFGVLALTVDQLLRLTG